MFTQSFRATILFGALVILGVGAYGLTIGPTWYLKAAVLLAAMSYLTQAVATVEAMLLDGAVNAAGWHDNETADNRRKAAAIWNKTASVMWLATLVAGGYVLASLVLS